LQNKFTANAKHDKNTSELKISSSNIYAGTSAILFQMFYTLATSPVLENALNYVYLAYTGVKNVLRNANDLYAYTFETNIIAI
jgi:hypothetical protein